MDKLMTPAECARIAGKLRDHADQSINEYPLKDRAVQYEIAGQLGRIADMLESVQVNGLNV